MPKIDDYELEVLTAFEKGQLNSVATKAELAKFSGADAQPGGTGTQVRGPQQLNKGFKLQTLQKSRR